jgi:hypothetical protein
MGAAKVPSGAQFNDRLEDVGGLLRRAGFSSSEASRSGHVLARAIAGISICP